MKPKYTYHSALSELVIDALLHLQFKINASTRFVPLAARNKIIKDWIEPKVKKQNYKELKSELQALLRIGKRGGDMEGKLIEINNLSIELNEKFTDADKLYIFFKSLKEHCNCDCVTMTEDFTDFLDGCLYMTERELDSGFGDDNKLLRPLNAIVVLSEGIDELLEKIRSMSDIFNVELDRSEGKNHHILISVESL